VLCSHDRTAALYWLPAAALGWIGTPSAAELRALTQLRRFRTLTCAATADGTLSVVKARGVEQRFSALRPGSTLRVAIVYERPDTGRSVRELIASYYQFDALVELHTEDRSLTPGDDPVTVEVKQVTGLPDRRLVVVEPGTRTAPLDLPPRLACALAGSTGAGAPRDSKAEPPWCDANDHAFAASVSALSFGAPDHDAFVAWLRTRGDVALGLVPGPVDAAALVGAAIVANALGEGSWNADLPSLAVALAHQAGIRAIRSRHVEPLVRLWLLQIARLTDGEWQRFGGLASRISEQVSPMDAEHIAAVARGVLSRSIVREEPELDAVAGALLAAIGQPCPIDLPWFADSTLGRLAPLGRALTPGKGVTVAQPRLLPGQVDRLFSVRAELVEASACVPLLAPEWRAGPDRRSALAALLESATAIYADSR
jgi:hypothetical protein